MLLMKALIAYALAVAALPDAARPAPASSPALLQYTMDRLQDDTPQPCRGTGSSEGKP